MFLWQLKKKYSKDYVKVEMQECFGNAKYFLASIHRCDWFINGVWSIEKKSQLLCLFVYFWKRKQYIFIRNLQSNRSWLINQSLWSFNSRKTAVNRWKTFEEFLIFRNTANLLTFDSHFLCLNYKKFISLRDKNIKCSKCSPRCWLCAQQIITWRIL